jgi:prolyl-tRNA synthetase
MMGGFGAHEYMAPSPSGEDDVALCDRCDYAANVEMAVTRLEPPAFPPANAVVEIETPGVATIEALAAHLSIDARTTSKAMPVVTDDGQLVLALVRGDRRLHELKLRKALGQGFRPATPEEIEAGFGARPGSIGPVGVDGRRVARIVADVSIADGVFVTGANRTGYHLLNVVRGRDYEAETADIQEVDAGDPCPLCGGVLRIEPVIEIGNIFKLGTKYSEALGATYLDESGREHPIVMGSYGIGPARVVAAAVEQSHDEQGIVWPVPVAPYDAWLVAIGDEAAEAGDRLSDELAELGLSSIVDDRQQSPGSKFADADLIGVPLRVTLGKRTVSDGTVDLRVRRDGRSETVAVAEAAERVRALREELRG